MAPRRAAILAVVLCLLIPAAADAKARWIVKGGGFGHGVGMSAYGAYGYGKKGVGYKRIVSHYFKDVRVAKLRRAPEVRVLIGVDPGRVKFSNATRACGRRLRASRTYVARRGGSGIRLTSGSGRKIAGCGKRLLATGRGSVEVGGRGRYRGSLLLVPGGDALNVVNVVGLNHYVRGVIPKELFPDWPMETLKAFAVAMRSIALTTDVGGKGYDLYADTRTQVYGGASVETRKTNRAVEATRNEVVRYGRRIAQTTYFSSSGGQTESRFLGGPEVPWFKSVKDPYDFHSPLHRWRFKFSQAEMQAKLGPYVRGRLKRIRVTKRGDSPRIVRAKLIGTGGSSAIRGDTLQAALGLYDRWAFFTRRRG